MQSFLESIYQRDIFNFAWPLIKKPIYIYTVYLYIKGTKHPSMQTIENLENKDS